MIKKHSKTINPNEEIFGKRDYEHLCKLMNWFDNEETRNKIKSIKVNVIVEVI